MLSGLMNKPSSAFKAVKECPHITGFAQEGEKWICTGCRQRVRLDVWGNGVLVKFTRTVQSIGVC